MQLKQFRLDSARERLTKSERRFTFALVVLASLLLVSCLFYNFVIPQTAARMMRSGAALIPSSRWWSWIVSIPVPIPHESRLLAGLLIALAVIAFTAYGLAIYVSWHYPNRSTSLVVAVVAALGFSWTSVWALPTVNSDIFIYMVHGRVAAVYGRNPYYVPPSDYPDDPIYPYASPRYTPYVEDKLPTWTWINIGLARVAGDDPATNLIVYRLALWLFGVANLGLIAAITHRLRPQFLLTGIIVYGWNPIAAMYGPGKVDTVMVFFLLLAILLLVAGRRRLAVVAFGLSVFVKLLTLPLVVAQWLWELRLGRWRPVAVHAALFALISLGVYLPFLQEPSLIARSIWSLLIRAAPSASIPILGLLAFAFLFFSLWVGRSQDGSYEKLLHGWAIVALGYSFILARFGLSYYLMTLIALVSLVPNGRIAIATIILSFVSFVLNAWYTTSNSAFPLPDLLPLPWHSFWFAILGFSVVSLAAHWMWRKFRQSPRATNGRHRQGSPSTIPED
jgi:hypothetical protein